MAQWCHQPGFSPRPRIFLSQEPHRGQLRFISFSDEETDALESTQE